METFAPQLTTNYEWLLNPSARLVVAVFVQEEQAVVHQDLLFDQENEIDAACGRISHATGLDVQTVRAELDQMMVSARDWAQRQGQVAAAVDTEDFVNGVLDSAALAGTDYPRTWLVEPLLLRGEPAIVGGPKKCLKSSLLTDLALSLGTGRAFLDRFAVSAPSRIAVFSGESGAATIQETAMRICAAMRRELRNCRNVLWGFRLPRLSRDDDLVRLGDFLREKAIEVAIIDPLYLCLLDGSNGLSATNLFDVGPVLRRMSQVCLDAGATPILVHHASKGAAARKIRKGEPLDLEDLAFAGVAEFARQWLLINRRHAYRAGSGSHKLWLNVGGSAGHGGLWAVDVEEGSLGTDFQGRIWQVTTRSGSEVQQEAPAGENDGRDARRQAKEEQALPKVLEFLATNPDGETAATIKKAIECGSRIGESLPKRLAEEGVIVPTMVAKQAGRGRVEHKGWKLAPANAMTATEDEELSSEVAEVTEDRQADDEEEAELSTTEAPEESLAA